MQAGGEEGEGMRDADMRNQGSAVPGGNGRRQRRPSTTRKKGWEEGRSLSQEEGAQPSAAKSASNAQKYWQAEREAVKEKSEGSCGSGAGPGRPGNGGGGSATRGF